MSPLFIDINLLYLKKNLTYMSKEIYVSRCLPLKNGVHTEIEKCTVKSIEVGRDYVRKLGWKLISSNEPFQNVEHIEIFERRSSKAADVNSKKEFIERYVR